MAWTGRTRTRQERRRLARLNGDASDAPSDEPSSRAKDAAKETTLWRRFARLYGLDGAMRYGHVVWVLALGTVASYIGRGAAMPFVVVYLTSVAKVISIPFAGVGIMVEQVVRALLSPVFGSLSDRYGRKPFMTGGLVLQSLTIPAYVLVDGPASFMAVCVLAGLGQAPYQPTLSAFLADRTPSDQRVGVFGLVHMMKNLGYSLGILFGGLLVTQGYAMLFLTGGIFPLVYAVFIALLVTEPRRRRARRQLRGRHPLVGAVTAARNPRFAAFLAVACITFVSWGVVANLLPVFIQEPQALGFDATWVTKAYTLNSLLVVAFQVPVSERIASRVHPTHGLAFACLATGVAYAMLAGTVGLVAENPHWAQAGLLAATAVLTLAEMFDTPLLFSVAADLAPPEATGGAMGVLGLPALLGYGAPLLVAGVAAEMAGWTMAWLVLTALLVAGAVGFTLLPTSTASPAAKATSPSASQS